jgi:hypothetical protein
MAGKRGRLLDGAWLAFWVAVSTAWCAGEAYRLGAAFDETFYMSAGLEAWRTGSSKRLLDAGTMPLPIHATTLPVYLWERLRGQPFDVERFSPDDPKPYLPWEQRRRQPFDRDAELERILPVTRLATLPFWWLLLAYGWVAGRRAAGAWGGRLAVAFLACEPTLLAHAGLATTDVALTACLLALFVHFRAGHSRAWGWRVGLPAAWFALAILAKASGLVFGLLGMGVLEAERRLRENGGERPVRTALGVWLTRRFALDLLQTGGIALAAVLLYCGCDWRASPSFVEWAHQLPEGASKPVMVWVAENLRIFSNAGNGLASQIRHNIRGHEVYLLGAASPRAIWYYFPVALTIKLTLAVLFLPPLLALLSARSFRNWMCLLAGAFLLFSLTCRVQNGVRLLMPFIALGVVGLGAALAHGVESLPGGWRRRVLVGATAAGLGWAAWSAAAVWPNNLCYTNELWGGTAEGYRLLSDTNYDWGQGVKELARWQRRHEDAPLDVWYFGTDPAVFRLKAGLFDPKYLPKGEPDRFRARFRGRYLAVGATWLYGGYCNQAPRARFAAWLRQQQPCDRTSTFFIYDFTAPEGRAGVEVSSSAPPPPG